MQEKKLSTMEKLVGHFKTITYHRYLVRNYCFRVGLYKQGLLHDLSKYSPSEFWIGVHYYQGGKRSPNAAEREEKGYSLAWMHHKGRNKHHYEYWNDVGKDKVIAGVKMPLKYAVEMFMDRIAACKVYKGRDYTDWTPWEYYVRTKDYILIHPETRALLEKLLKMLAKRGEDYTFRYIKKVLLPKGDY